MPSQLEIIDPLALGLVVFGTLFATVARSGWRDTGEAIAVLLARGFCANANRSALAQCLRSVRSRGALCTEADLPPDKTLGACVKAYLAKGSTQALTSTYAEARASLYQRRVRIIAVFENASDLAPMFGLVGTLVAIMGLSPSQEPSETSAILAGISAAVQSTLFGVLLSSFVFAPLGSMIDRKLCDEERARDDLFEWFISSLERGESTAEPLRKVA